MDKVSVITIVYNDKDHILDTMCSIIEQTYDHIEYILIDGKSSDGTTELIINKIQDIASVSLRTKDDDKLYIEAIDKLNPSKTYKILSQKDSGIYDAMNKGVDLSTGKWCNFMNCGDRFYEKETIGFVMDNLKNSKKRCSIVYGNTQIIFSDSESKIIKSRDRDHKYCNYFIHQSSFIELSVMNKFKYDINFKIAGDKDFFARAYNSGVVFCYIDCVISKYNVYGISSNLSISYFIEDCKIGYRYNIFFPFVHFIKYIFWLLPRAIVRNILPKSIRNKARIIFGKKKW